MQPPGLGAYPPLCSRAPPISGGVISPYPFSPFSLNPSSPPPAPLPGGHGKGDPHSRSCRIGSRAADGPPMFKSQPPPQSPRPLGGASTLTLATARAPGGASHAREERRALEQKFARRWGLQGCGAGTPARASVVRGRGARRLPAAPGRAWGGTPGRGGGRRRGKSPPRAARSWPREPCRVPALPELSARVTLARKRRRGLARGRERPRGRAAGPRAEAKSIVHAKRKTDVSLARASPVSRRGCCPPARSPAAAAPRAAAVSPSLHLARLLCIGRFIFFI